MGIDLVSACIFCAGMLLGTDLTPRDGLVGRDRLLLRDARAPVRAIGPTRATTSPTSRRSSCWSASGNALARAGRPRRRHAGVRVARARRRSAPRTTSRSARPADDARAAIDSRPAPADTRTSRFWAASRWAARDSRRGRRGAPAPHKRHRRGQHRRREPASSREQRILSAERTDVGAGLAPPLDGARGRGGRALDASSTGYNATARSFQECLRRDLRRRGRGALAVRDAGRARPHGGVR